MTASQFKTTADVFAVIKPEADGSYRCPIDGCPKPDKLFVDKKRFGFHLSVTHHLLSTKASNNGQSKRRYSRRRKSVTVAPIVSEQPAASSKPVERELVYCYHCGSALEPIERAIELLKRRGIIQ